jgi:hypothetical protein
VRLHRRWGYPLWWELSISVREWGLPLAIEVRTHLIDGSGRREHVARVNLSLFCLHWDVHYAWGRRRYHPPSERILSLREVLERDRTQPWSEMSHAEGEE